MFETQHDLGLPTAPPAPELWAPGSLLFLPFPVFVVIFCPLMACSALPWLPQREDWPVTTSQGATATWRRRWRRRWSGQNLLQPNL